MSENMIAFGMAAKLSDDALPKDPADREEITEAWAENALHTNYAGDLCTCMSSVKISRWHSTIII